MQDLCMIDMYRDKKGSRRQAVQSSNAPTIQFHSPRVLYYKQYVLNSMLSSSLHCYNNNSSLAVWACFEA